MVGDEDTPFGNTNLMGASKLVLPFETNVICHSIYQNNRYLYLEFDLFLKTNSASAHTAAIPSEMELSKICAISDRVHKHIYGYSALSDMKILLERNQTLSNMANSFIDSVVLRCETCRGTARLRQARKVSLASRHRQFNKVVCVGHYYLDEVCLFYVMDTHTTHSATHICHTTSLSEAVAAFEDVWLRLFWCRDAEHADQAFQKGML